MRRRDFIVLAVGMAVIRPFTAQPPPPTVLNMGMGLAIGHTIVEARGGQPSAENLAGRSAAFRVRLPLAELPQ